MGKQVVLQSLLNKREQLICERDFITGKFLFTFRKNLQNKVRQLDVEINKLNFEILNVRSTLNFARHILIRATSQPF